MLKIVAYLSNKYVYTSMVYNFTFTAIAFRNVFLLLNLIAISKIIINVMEELYRNKINGSEIIWRFWVASNSICHYFQMQYNYEIKYNFILFYFFA